MNGGTVRNVTSAARVTWAGLVGAAYSTKVVMLAWDWSIDGDNAGGVNVNNV